MSNNIPKLDYSAEELISSIASEIRDKKLTSNL